MKSLLRSSALAAAFAFVTGCAGISSRDHAGGLPLDRIGPHQRGETELRRFDEPDAAQQFFLAQRLPKGAVALETQRYVGAMQQASSLPWYSLASGQTLAAATPDRR